MDFSAPLISYVIPVLNEESNIINTVERVMESFSKLQITQSSCEILFVDDGSTDQTVEIIESISLSNSSVKCVCLGRNYGHQPAVSAGLAFATGDYVAILDGDLQDPPEVINIFYHKLQEGYDIAYGIRRKRKEGILLRISYKLFYRVLAALSQIDIPLDSGDFCLMNRSFLHALLSVPETNRFVRGLRSYVGFRQIGVAYERSARASGDPKYNLRKLLRLASDGIFNFSDRPLKLATGFGFLLALMSFALGLSIISGKIFNASLFGFKYALIPGYATIFAFLCSILGVQLMSTGILGEYISRIFLESKRRPSYIVRKLVGSFSDNICLPDKALSNRQTS